MVRQLDNQQQFQLPEFDPDFNQTYTSSHNNNRVHSGRHHQGTDCSDGGPSARRQRHHGRPNPSVPPTLQCSRSPDRFQGYSSGDDDGDGRHGILRRRKVRKWRSLNVDDEHQKHRKSDAGKSAPSAAVPPNLLRLNRPSSYLRFKYPVQFHRPAATRLTCSIPDCLRKRPGQIIYMLPVRQGPARKHAAVEAAGGHGGRSRHDDDPPTEATKHLTIDDLEAIAPEADDKNHEEERDRYSVTSRHEEDPVTAVVELEHRDNDVDEVRSVVSDDEDDRKKERRAEERRRSSTRPGSGRSDVEIVMMGSGNSKAVELQRHDSEHDDVKDSGNDDDDKRSRSSRKKKKKNRSESESDNDHGGRRVRSRTSSRASSRFTSDDETKDAADYAADFEGEGDKDQDGADEAKKSAAGLDEDDQHSNHEKQRDESDEKRAKDSDNELPDYGDD